MESEEGFVHFYTRQINHIRLKKELVTMVMNLSAVAVFPGNEKRELGVDAVEGREGRVMCVHMMHQKV